MSPGGPTLAIMSWSLAEELKGASGCRSVEAALRSLALCGNNHQGCSTEVVQDWHRSGSETYGLIFDVKHCDSTTTRLFLKACVAFAPESSVGETAHEWLRRREVVRRASIETPHLYSLHNAGFLEEYIPYTFEAAWRRAKRIQRRQLARAFGAVAHRLATHGFPVLSLHDVRSRGNDIVVVDFGSDLGPPNFAPLARTDLLELAVEHVNRWCADTDHDPAADVIAGYGEPAPSRTSTGLWGGEN
jgi:hypothetical protein